MTQHVIDVWTEVGVSANGISVSLYSETSDGRVLVEDETYFTFDELEAQSPAEPLSLNLSDGTRAELLEALEAARDEPTLG